MMYGTNETIIKSKSMEIEIHDNLYHLKCLFKVIKGQNGKRESLIGSV